MKTRITLLTLAGALVIAPAAAAHVTPNPSEAPAGGFAMVSFRVPHGCEDSPTTSLTIRIPEGVVSVTPQAVPGWRVTTQSGRLSEPVELHGETITEGVKQVTWTGGPLDPHQFTDFGISMRMPERPGETLSFPAIQRCQQGQIRWIQIPVQGEPEPDEPAPQVTLVEGGDESGAGATQELEEQLAAAETKATELEAAVASAQDEADTSATRANVALGLGIAGLAAGLVGVGFGLRRRSPT